MSIETGVVINLGDEPIYWHLPEGRNAAYLPDSRKLWDVIWENRDNVWGFAHSHPGAGVPSPSQEDITTFAAIEKGIGRRLTWWICSADTTIEVRHNFASVRCPVEFRHQYHQWPVNERLFPSWLGELRRLSYKQEK